MGQMKGRRNIGEKVVAEYLAGDVSYRELEVRYGVSSSTLNRWVKHQWPLKRHWKSYYRAIKTAAAEAMA